ncbi:MAG: type II toxin-antitoxin system RelE/ParE family toxin [Alphaproteobacteria bacterium]|nr:type II toxin-antitoxin system RelE/ParE family toxin [Alphaproteobacteria bacterium]
MQIIWRAAAIRDLNAIREFIAQDKPKSADRVRSAIRTAVERLADHPNLGRAGHVDGTRELVIAGTPYIIAYRVAAGSLRILAVMHGSRRWPDRF